MHPKTQFTFTLLLISMMLALFVGAAEGQQIIRVHAENAEAFNLLNVPKGLDRCGMGLNHVDFLVSERERALFDELRIPYRIQDPDAAKTASAVRASYPSLSAMENELSSTAASYPAITRLYSLGKSHQNRDIWCMEISDNPGVNEDETELLFIGLHHAREWPTVVMTLHIIEQLTTNYGSDPTITSWVDNRRIFVVACQNPDGYYYSHDQNNTMWRKNRHYLPQHGTTGVDLNRNYPGCTCGIIEGDWGSIGDGSVTHEPNNDTYCGPGPGSELETQAIMDLILAQNFTGLISFHTYSELVLWPYGFDGGTQAPDNSLLASTGTAMANLINGQYGGKYTPTQSAGLYPTTGDTTDWAYGIYYFTQGKNVLPYTFEMAASSFQPPTSQLDQIINENWDAVEYMLQQADTLRNSMTQFVLPPVVNAPPVDNDGNYRVTWNESNPDANPTKFQLDELSAFSTVTDGAETGTTYIAMDGWTTSTAKKHSGSRSFRAPNTSSRTSGITTKYPRPVEVGDTLNFWTWYDIEVDYDFGFVEVSKDQRLWEQLDSYNGNSGGWQNKSYSLNAFVGDDIYIRFRYTTDTNTLGDGFYVDDIQNVPYFGVVNTLSNNITYKYYDITGKSTGDYYYRVKGYSATRGWGDFSQLGMTEVAAPVGPLYADTYTVSASAGVVVNFTLAAGAPYAGRDYLLLGSFSGSVPGIDLPGGPNLPLNWDNITNWILFRLNTASCVDFMSTLDGSGLGAATFDTQGAIDPRFAGRTLTFAYLLGPNPDYDFTSNAVGITIVP